jgi:hypothetical protein
MTINDVSYLGPTAYSPPFEHQMSNDMNVELADVGAPGVGPQDFGQGAPFSTGTHGTGFFENANDLMFSSGTNPVVGTGVYYDQPVTEEDIGAPF